MEYTKQLKSYIKDLGADLVGVTDTISLTGLKTDPENLLETYSHAISIAACVPKSVFDLIKTHPTPLYSSVYQTINRFLDDVAYQTSKRLQTDGYLSLPIPASQIIDHDNWYGAVSHKAVARTAGLGWQGKNLLLITPDYGSRVRLVTVLTQAPLHIDNPVKNRCGICNACKEACPVGAIKGVPTDSHYDSRDQALYFEKCVTKLTKEFQDLPGVGVPICGLCIKACPYGDKLSASQI